MKQKDNYTFLTQAPVHKVILTMAIPTIISMLVTSLYNMADTFFVGQINTQSTAAVGVSYSIMAIIQATGFFFGHGAGNYISRQLGARNIEKANIMASTGFFYSMGFGLMIAILGLIFLNPLSILLGSTPTILPYTEDYLGIVLLGAPFMTCSLSLNNQMRFQGNAALAMYGIVSGAILNVALDPLFIFAFGMEIKGAALATLISQICSFALLFYMSHKGGNISINIHNFSKSTFYLKEIFMGGTPSLSRQGLSAISTIMLNVAAGFYGDAAIAGMSIVTRISTFVFSSIVGLGQGFQPLCGFCYGAKLYDRVREGYAYCVKLGTVFITVLAVIGFTFAPQIVELFRSDMDVVEVGSAALRWQVIAYPVIPFVVAANMFLQTIRKPGRANLVAAARNGLFFIPLIIIMPHFFGLAGVETCQAISDILSFLLAAPIVYSAFADMRKELAK